MNDLLGTVKRKGAKPGKDIESGDSDDSDEEGTATENPDMDEFFREVADVKTKLDNIKRGLHKLEQAHEESKTVTRANKLKEIRERMERAGEEVGRDAKAAKEQLERLEKSNEAARKKKGCGEGSSQDRQRTSITLSNVKKLRDLMASFSDLREKLSSEYKDVVERRYQAIHGRKPKEEEVEDLMESGAADSLWQSSLKEQGRGQIMDTVQEISERHAAVKDLERQLIGLHEIFLQMATIVEEQGEMLDNIEKQVATSVDHVKEGAKHIAEAKELQKNTRKWMCCLVMIMVTIVFIIVMTVVKPWKAGTA